MTSMNAPILSAEASLLDLAQKLGVGISGSPKGYDAAFNAPACPAPQFVSQPQFESLPPAASFDLMTSNVLAYPCKADLQQHSAATQPAVLRSPALNLSNINLQSSTNAQSIKIPQAQGLSQVTDAWLQIAYQMLNAKNARPAQAPEPPAPVHQLAHTPTQLQNGFSLPQQQQSTTLNSFQALQALLSPPVNGGLNLDFSKFSVDTSSSKRSRQDATQNQTSTTSETDAGSCESGESAPKRVKRVRSQTLNAFQAKEIFKLRPSELPPGVGTVGHTADLAAKYQVATNTIRDIWNRRSWAKATLPFWTPKELQDYRDTYVHTGISLVWLDAYTSEPKSE